MAHIWRSAPSRSLSPPVFSYSPGGQGLGTGTQGSLRQSA